MSENMAASNSRIQDADFAVETAAMSRSQILQQAGVAVLAQAQAEAPQNKDVYAVMRTVLERAGMFDEALKANEIYGELTLD